MNINVIVTPASSRRTIVEKQGTFHVYTTKPAVDGAANSDVIAQLAKHFHVPKSAVTILRGAMSRTKVVIVDRDGL